MVKKTVDLLPKGHNNRPGYSMKPKGLLFHTTNNWADGAGDESHAEYMENQKTRVVSWHATVDKDSWTQHIPFSENAWHAGDGGKGFYNRNWIGLEIACEAVAPGQKLDAATYKNAVEVAAEIMKENGLTEWGQLQPHNIVYGKNCPHTTLFSRDQFKRDVFAKMAANEQKPAAPKPATGGDGGVYTVERGDNLTRIADAFKTTVDKLVEINGIKDPSTIYPGQKIKLPSYLHVVQKGENLTEIAEMYNTSVDYLARLNGLENPNMLSIGQRLKLAGTAPAAAPKQPAAKPTPKYNLPAAPLRPGNKGQAVTDLQEVLTKINFLPGKIDGSYGPKTADAVARFQSTLWDLRKEQKGVYTEKTRQEMAKKL